ncbi:hypothetical protein GCM10023169_37170 [Georgenia halophila]|uniref:DUF2975 domain-containing protein n=1 Tax=Georgenia halophila TaxID=620889 RepID=A0ABP8LN38_9MICO
MTKRNQTLKDRRSEAGLAKSLVTVIGGLAVLNGLAGVFVLLSGHWLFTNGDARRPTIAELPQSDFTFVEGQTVYLTDLPLWIRLVFALPGSLLTLIYLVSALSVRRLVIQIGRGEPFSVRARRSLAALSLTLLSGSLLDLIITFTLEHSMPEQITAHLHGQGIQLASFSHGPNWHVMLLVLGAISSALLAAFSDGARLREEAEGVV